MQGAASRLVSLRRLQLTDAGRNANYLIVRGLARGRLAMTFCNNQEVAKVARVATRTPAMPKPALVDRNIALFLLK